MGDKWYSDKVEEAILASRFSRTNTNEGQEDSESPGKNVEVYELHGMFPESWLGKEYYGSDWEDNGKYVRQMHIVTFFTDSSDKRNGICLYKGKTKNIFKTLKRDDVEGRACGRGGIEELFHPQIWTNYSEIHIQQMLEAVAKIILLTNDKKLKNQKWSSMQHGTIQQLEDGKDLKQLVIQPINKTAFDNFVNKWEQVARIIGSASDPQLGLNPVSGTPLGTTQIVTSQGIGIHEYRRGQIAVFWGEIYRDWVMKTLRDDLNKGDEWLDELDIDELQDVANKVSVNLANQRVKDAVLKENKLVTNQERDVLTQLIKEEFIKGGKKRFLTVMKGEFAKIPLKVKFNIAGKQRNLAENVSKLNSIFRVLFTPQGVAMIQSNQGLADLLNEILEISGISPVDFAGITGVQTQPQLSPLQPTQPQMQPLATNNNINE
jgi:hypothetical protein